MRMWRASPPTYWPVTTLPLRRVSVSAEQRLNAIPPITAKRSTIRSSRTNIKYQLRKAQLRSMWRKTCDNRSAFRTLDVSTRPAGCGLRVASGTTLLKAFDQTAYQVLAAFQSILIGQAALGARVGFPDAI